jgi:hypothetical protein
MISRGAVLLLALLLSRTLAAAEIRQFDLRTLQRLGNQLIRATQRPDRGATDPLRKRARQTAIAAVKDRLFEVRYDYVVLDDPDGTGFLVYALALADTRRTIQTGGHFRVTVSAEGGTVERIDFISAFIQIKAHEPDIITSTQHSSNLPAETWLYTSHVYRVPILVGTKDRAFWIIANGKIEKDMKAELDGLGSKPKKK